MNDIDDATSSLRFLFRSQRNRTATSADVRSLSLALCLFRHSFLALVRFELCAIVRVATHLRSVGPAMNTTVGSRLSCTSGRRYQRAERRPSHARTPSYAASNPGTVTPVCFSWLVIARVTAISALFVRWHLRRVDRLLAGRRRRRLAAAAAGDHEPRRRGRRGGRGRRFPGVVVPVREPRDRDALARVVDIERAELRVARDGTFFTNDPSSKVHIRHHSCGILVIGILVMAC